MDSRFIKTLKESAVAEQRSLQTEIGQLEQTLAALVAEIANSFPEQSERLTQLGNDMQMRFNALRHRDRGVEAYFTANGPVAKKLKEHVSIAGWITSATVGELRAGTLTQNLMDKIMACDFKPTREITVVGELNSFLMSIRERINDLAFSTPQAPLTNVPIGSLKTGIYGEGSDSSQYIVVLRTNTSNQKGVETLFLSRPGHAPSLYYWHPIEHDWILSDWTVTFVGVKQKLEEEFNRACGEANRLEKGFDFDQEIARLTERGNEIFLNDHYLPRTRMQQRPNNKVDVIYERSPDGGATIQARHEDVALVFQHSRGVYQMTKHVLIMYMKGTGVMLGAVTADQLPRDMQRQLIQRANQVFTYLQNDLRNANMMQAQKVARQAGGSGGQYA